MILKRGITVHLYKGLIQNSDMAPFIVNVFDLVRVMCVMRDTWLSLNTREYYHGVLAATALLQDEMFTIDSQVKSHFKHQIYAYTSQSLLICYRSCSYDWLCFSYVGSRKSSNFDSQTENQNIQKKWMKGMPCISTQNSLLAMHILMGDFEWLNFPAVAHVILFCFWVYIKTNIIIMCLIHSLLVKFWPPLREY